MPSSRAAARRAYSQKIDRRRHESGFRLFGLDRGRAARRVRVRHDRARARRADQRAMDRDRRRLRVFDRVPLLQPLHREQGRPARRPAHDARRQVQRRPRLRADQQIRAVRPSFRRDRRRGPARRPGARRADGLHARHAVDSRGRRVRGRGAGLHRAVHLDAPRRPLARRPRQDGARHGARRDRAVRGVPDHGDHSRGARADRREGAHQFAVGHVHRRRDDSDRAVHGRLHALHPAGPDRRSVDHRLRAADGVDRVRPARARFGRARRVVHVQRHAAHVDPDRLRLRRVGAAGVAAARAARLPVDVPEDRHDRRPRDRHPDRRAGAEDAGAHEVRRRHGPGLVGQPVPVPVHHDRVRARCRASIR
ncbi:hypothetical protein Y049_4167 [Burkholderia pseudomallei MSHR684]|nr:hypothetical protein Y049_4167 [Burkholderia pseudomallei MSHR684]